MLMNLFNSFPPPEQINFLSNPSLPDQVVIVPDKDERGNVMNKVTLQPGDNSSPFKGVHFSRELHSLRAKLNLGIQLKQVSMPSMASDPLDAERNIERVVVDLENKFSNLPVEEDVVEESKEVVVESKSE